MFENFIFPYSLFLVFIIYLFICLPILVFLIILFTHPHKQTHCGYCKLNPAFHPFGVQHGAGIYNRTHTPQRTDLKINFNQSVLSESDGVAVDWLKPQPIKHYCSVTLPHRQFFKPADALYWCSLMPLRFEACFLGV